MLKIVVFDGGCGGELFADKLASELPVVEILRVIDWRSAEVILAHPKKARLAAENALRPYIGKVDLIILANYLISATSLNYFRRKYRTQKFVGFTFEPRRMVLKKSTLILTTTATARSLTFFRLARKLGAKTVCLDNWPRMIDNGELTNSNVEGSLDSALNKLSNFSPEQIILVCGQFVGFEPEFHNYFGHNVRIVDGFDDAIRSTYRALKIKGVPKIKK